MRRFITLMVGAMVLFVIGFSSSTALAYDKPNKMYLFGQINGKSKWNELSESDMVPMTDIGNNTWKVQITSDGTSYFRICAIPSTGSWYFGAPRNTDQDVDLNTSGENLPTWNKGTSGDGKAFKFSDLKGKYIYVTWANDGDGCFTVSVVDETSADTYPSTLYLYDADTSSATPFATLAGDGNGKYTVSKETSGGLTVNQVYKFFVSSLASASSNEWSLHNGKRYTPGSDKNISNPGSMDLTLSDSGTVVYSTDKEGTATFSFTLNSDLKGGKFEVAFEPSSVGVTYPTTLYIYTTTDYNTPFATLTGDGNGKYTATKTTGTDISTNKSYYLFVSKLGAGSNRSDWNSHNGNRYTTGSDNDRTITTTGFKDLILTDSGSIEYIAAKDGKATFTFTMNSDLKGGKFEVAFEASSQPTDEYLYVYRTGQFNTPSVTLKKEDDGHYRTTLTADEITKAFPDKRVYYLFVSDEKISGTAWNSFAGHMWTPDGNQDVANGKTIPMQKEDNNAFVWNYKNDLTDLTFDVVLGDNASFTMSTSLDQVANIFIFGDLGYSDSWDGEHKTSQCILTKTGKYKQDGNEYDLYTGTIKLKTGKNKFRVLSNNVEFGPTGSGHPKDYAEQVKLDKMFKVAQYQDNDWHFEYSSTKDMVRDVELVYYGVNDFGITIKSAAVAGNLYLYDETNLAQPLGTFEYEYDGVYSVTYTNPQTDLGLNKAHKLFLTDKEVANATSMQSFTNRWTTVNSGDVRLTNNDAVTEISKNTTGGVMNWSLTDKNVSEVKMTADIKKGTFTISTTTSTTEYYLTGDINDWAIKDDNNVASPELRSYRFVPVKNADVNNEDGWYVLYVPRMHGQFKIHQGKWDASNWGCNWKRTKDGVGSYDNMTYKNDKEEIHKYIEASKAAESMPAEANLSSGTDSYFNVRCQRNYYNDAYIYFNPTDNKLFIKGNQENIYVYYYNGEDADEKAGTAQIYVRANVVNENENHYYYDDRILLDHPMPFETLTDEEMNIPVLRDNVQAYNGTETYKCYKIRVSPGLEEPYNAGGKKHSFEFYLSGAKKVTENDKQVFTGHSIYYVYSGVLPAVVFHYEDIEGNESLADLKADGVSEISYRMVAINASGEPEYIKEDGTRTKKRSEAPKYILDYELTVGTDGFAPEGSATGTKWLGVTKKATVQSIMAKEVTDWTSKVEPVQAGNVNRYVEFDVRLKDPDSDNYYHEFHSDFELSADNEKDAFVQDGGIDLKAQMTGKFLSGREVNPQYKLNGTHLYAMAETSVPTGIKDIEVDNNEYDNDGEAETVYYNLQGVRVANPDRGIYIMVKGKTSKKVRF